MEVQWYPGHMTKAIRQMREDMKVIDLVIELLDARAPESSRNPDIEELGQNKARLILLNKNDLSDAAVTKEWISYYQDKGYEAVAIDARNRASFKQIDTSIDAACKQKRERDARRGIKNRPIRAMVVGIPNIGKSTFINSYAKKSATKTGNKPGVTKGKQWIRLNKDVELLDTPGILWPKFEDEMVGLRLAALGSIKNDVLKLEELSFQVVGLINEIYPGRIEEVYELDDLENEAVDGGVDVAGNGTGAATGNAVENNAAYSVQIMLQIAEKRNCLKSGGELDLDKAERLFLDDVKNGRLGRLSLEKP